MTVYTKMGEAATALDNGNGERFLFMLLLEILDDMSDVSYLNMIDTYMM